MKSFFSFRYGRYDPVFWYHFFVFLFKGELSISHWRAQRSSFAPRPYKSYTKKLIATVIVVANSEIVVANIFLRHPVTQKNWKEKKSYLDISVSWITLQRRVKGSSNTRSPSNDDVAFKIIIVLVTNHY
jgi:hypothetical protein